MRGGIEKRFLVAVTGLVVGCESDNLFLLCVLKSGTFCQFGFVLTVLVLVAPEGTGWDLFSIGSILPTDALLFLEKNRLGWNACWTSFLLVPEVFVAPIFLCSGLVGLVKFVLQYITPSRMRGAGTLLGSIIFMSYVHGC